MSIAPITGFAKTANDKTGIRSRKMPSLQIKVMRVFLLSAVTFALTGCFSSNPKDIEAFLKPYQTSVTSEKYVLQPPDEIEVHCARVPELNLQRQRVRPDGKLSFEVLGEFQAAGKTPAEVAADIKQKASTLYALVGDQPIEVRVIVFKSKVFYVIGQVDRFGPKLYTGRDSVMSAISDAQPNSMAWLGRIQVIRPSVDEKVKAKIFEVDFDRMAAHGELGKNVLLQEGDVIYVPPTVLAAISMKIEEIIRPIARAFTGANIVQSGTANTNLGGYSGQ